MMATKKLSDNSLNFVSGGTCYETADDSRFLNVLLAGRPGQCDRYGSYRCWGGDHDKEIEAAWASVGIYVELHSGFLFSTGDDNTYWLNGKWMSQEDARQYAMDVVGKHLTRAQWDW